MAITYTQLRQAIQDTTENTEATFVSNLDRFILSAEDRVLKAVQLPDFRKNATSTTVNGARLLATPTDYLSPYSLEVNSGSEWVFLLEKDVNFIDQAYPSRSTGVPRFYSAWDDANILIGPTPDAAYSVELHYFARPESITTAAGGVSWLGTNAERALLYACLYEAYVFMKGEPDVLASYERAVAEEVGGLQVIGEGRNRKDDYRVQRGRREVL